MHGIVAAPVQLPEVLNSFQHLAGVVLFLLFLWAIGHCFLGCVVFRALLIGDAIIVGAMAGWFLVGSVRASPGGMDYFVATLAGAVLLGILALLAGRVAFALLVALSAAIIALAAGWILGILAGIAAFVIAYWLFRPMAVLATALDGAAVAVLAIVAMFLGDNSRLWNLLLGPDRHLGPTLILLGFVVALALAGGVLQKKLLVLIRTSLTAEDILRQGRRAHRNRSTVRPRFGRP